MKKGIALFIFFVLFKLSVSVNNFFFSPGLSVGYTFGGGMNWGILFDVGRNTIIMEKEYKYGLSFSWYYVPVQSTPSRKYKHRIRSFGSLMIENDFIDFNFGFGRAKNPWGNGNRCIVHGLMADISLTYPGSYYPWAGFKTLIYSKADWAWFDKPYNTVYLKYKYDVIQNTGLKEM